MSLIYYRCTRKLKPVTISQLLGNILDFSKKGFVAIVSTSCLFLAHCLNSFLTELEVVLNNFKRCTCANRNEAGRRKSWSYFKWAFIAFTDFVFSFIISFYDSFGLCLSAFWGLLRIRTESCFSVACISYYFWNLLLTLFPFNSPLRKNGTIVFFARLREV